MDIDEMPDDPEEEAYSQENQIVNLSAQDIGEDVHDAYKKNLIMNTTYNQDWTLETIIVLDKIKDEGWDESIDSRLCILWDMITDRNVALFLLNNDFLITADKALLEASEPRITELITGMIANMCAQEEVLESLANNEALVSRLMSFISSDDKDTLIQIMKIMHHALWDIRKNEHSPWLDKIYEYEKFGESLSFILENSLCGELLSPTLDLIYVISDTELSNKNLLLDLFDMKLLISGLCESMMVLVERKDDSHSEIQFKNIEAWFNVMFQIIKKNILIFQYHKNVVKIYLVLSRILIPYENPNNLFPLEDQCSLSIYNCLKIMNNMKNKMTTNFEVIQIMLAILINLNRELPTASESINYDDMKQLYVYVSNYWFDVLDIMKKNELKELLKSCNQESFNELRQIAHSHPKVKERSKIKLRYVKSVLFPTT